MNDPLLEFYPYTRPWATRTAWKSVVIVVTAALAGIIGYLTAPRSKPDR